VPIYEYQAFELCNGCHYCRAGFEIYQKIAEKPLSLCLYCGQPVKKIMSWCRATVVDKSAEHVNVKNKIKNYEKSGMWSHAAELADTHAEKLKDKGLRMRALDNYKKAGYDIDSLAKHAKLNDDG